MTDLKSSYTWRNVVATFLMVGTLVGIGVLVASCGAGVYTPVGGVGVSAGYPAPPPAYYR